MPVVIKKRRVVGFSFTVNDVTYRTRVGCHEVKSRFGRQAVLLRPHPKREASQASPSPSQSSQPPPQPATGLVASKMAKQLKRCTICAVDARGRFLVEAGGAYVLGAARSEEEMRNICKAEDSIYEAGKLRKPQKHPAVRRKVSNHKKFVAAFLSTFHAVSFGDANMAWGGFSKTERKEKDVAELIQATKDTGLYFVKTAPAQS